MNNTSTPNWPLPLLIVLELLVTALFLLGAMMLLQLDRLPVAWREPWMGAVLIVVAFVIELPVVLMLIRKKGQHSG